MNLLLDTHIWLWSQGEPQRLGSGVRAALQNEANQLWVSPISLWELALLAKKGRIRLDRGVVEWIASTRNNAPWREAALTEEVAILAAQLPFAHGDPADRFLVATAIVHRFTLVTADRKLIALEGVQILAN